MYILWVLLLLITLTPSTASSQNEWEKVHALFDGPETYSYFINDKIAFYCPKVSGQFPYFVRTTDGGTTWETMLAVDSMVGDITDIYFDSVHHGYAVTYQPAPVTPNLRYLYNRGKGIFETRDTGRTWKKISPYDSTSYGLQSTGRVYSIGNTILTNTIISTDRGRSWMPCPWDSVWGIDIEGTPEGLIVFAGLKNGPNFSAELSVMSYSRDSGKTWITIESPLDFRIDGHGIEGDIYIDRSGNIFALSYELKKPGDSVGDTVYSKIMVSTDTGRTWTKKYQTRWKYGTSTEGEDPQGITLQGINGSGCAIYVSMLGAQNGLPDTTLGLLRSTDVGGTWEFVGGPFYYENEGGIPGWRERGWASQIGVFGNGAVVRTFGYSRNPYSLSRAYLYKTQTGGDGKLSDAPRPGVIALSHKLFSSASTPSSSRDTLHARTCDSSSLEVLFNYRNTCSSARLRSIAIDGLPKHQYTTTTLLRPVSDLLTDSATATIYPETPGTYNLRVIATYEYNANTDYDTSFNIVLVVHPNPSVLTIDGRKSYDLGIQRLCNIQTVIDSFSLSALGCDPYAVASIRFEEDQTNSGFSVWSESNLTLTSDGTDRYFQIGFTPKTAGVFTGRIVIDHGATSDTIDVRAEAANDDRTLVLKADTVETRLCETADAIVTLTNTSCQSMMLDSLRVPEPLELLAGQLPIDIPAGKSIELRVRFEPVILGVHTVDAIGSLRFMAPGNTIVFDTLLHLTVLGLRGLPQTVTTDTVIDIGKISICGDHTLSIPIGSIGCDTLDVNGTTLSSSTQGFALGALSSNRIPVADAATLSIRFVPPSVGQFTTDLMIQTSGGNRKITLRGEGIPGTRTLSATLTTLDFGQTTICDERDSTVSLTNTGCDTLIITNANIDKNFDLADVEYPIVLTPGQSIDLPIVTVVDTTGKPTVLTGTLTVTSTADNTLQPIALTRSLVYPTRLRIEAIDEASGRVGDEVKFNLILEGEVPATMTALYFDFLHDNDLLSFTDLTGNGLSITNTTGNANQRQRFTFSPVKEGVIGEMTFRTFLAHAENTMLTFDNIHFDAAGVTVAPECIAVISDSGSRFNYIYSCGEGMVKDYLVNDRILIRNISPNPAHNEIVLEIDQAITDGILTIYDLSGAKVLNQSIASTVDISALPEGTYFLSVTSSIGFSQTQRFVIQR